MTREQSTMFEAPAGIRRPDRIAVSAYRDEKTLIRSILWLYNAGGAIELDPCFSTGMVWLGLPRPRLRFDISEALRTTDACADARRLPLPSDSIASAFFDPPFVIGGQTQSGIIASRFGGFHSVDALESMYGNCLSEFARVLKSDGMLIIKCQDTVVDHKQVLSHVSMVLMAKDAGFTMHDCLVLVSDYGLIDPGLRNQEHARKIHSYYLVASKGPRNPAVLNRRMHDA